MVSYSIWFTCWMCTVIYLVTMRPFFLLIHFSGIEPWTFIQRLGDAVLIPAGCPYQVRNLMV